MYYTVLYYIILSYIVLFYIVISYIIIYHVPFSDGMATSFACATHLQSRTSGYPIHLSFLRGDGHLLHLSLGVAIPIYLHFWRMGGHLLHVRYYNVIACIIPNYQVLQCIRLYYAVLYCAELRSFRRGCMAIRPRKGNV